MNTYLKLGIALAIAAGAAGVLWWTYSTGRSAGQAIERTAWQARELEQQQTYAAEIQRLRNQKDAQLAALQGDLAKAEGNFEIQRKKAANEKTRNDRVAADIRAGRLVLRDRGAGAGEAGGGKGPTGAAPTCSGDGQAADQGELSSELGEFLWGEASRADEVIEDLEAQLSFAQDTIGAYYRMARDCNVVGN